MIVRMLTCFIVGSIFGILHAIEYKNWTDALNVFIKTGALGLSFASIFLYSKNLFMPMILHAIYDIPANLFWYAKIRKPLGTFYNNFLNSIYGFIVLFAIFLIVLPSIKNVKIGRQIQTES